MSFQDFLGKLGDALLIGNDADPIYQPRMQQKQINDIINSDFQTDPERGINRVRGINLKAGNDLSKSYNDSLNDQMTRRKTQDEIDRQTIENVVDMYKASTAETYGRMLPIMKRRAEERGTKLPFDLPEIFDPKFDPTRFAIPAKDQMTADNIDAYRDEQNRLKQEEIDIRRSEATSRNNQRTANIAIKAGDLRAKTALAGQRGVTQAIGVDNRGVKTPSTKASKSSSSSTPPGTPSPGQKLRNKVTGEVWMEKNGKWTKAN